MTGLTDEGFLALSHEEIKERIRSRIEVLNPGFDFSPESPDGMNIEIFGYELSQLWHQLSLVYYSGDPRVATGQGLRNIGLISGVLMDNADRSHAIIALEGVAGTIVPSGSMVSDVFGNEFVTEFEAVIPSNVNAIAKVAGLIPVEAGTLITIETPVAGWDSISQPKDGIIGTEFETEQHFRNKRTRSVMISSESVVDALRGKLIGIGLDQVNIAVNDTVGSTLDDGTPPGNIHVIVTDSVVSDLLIAETISRYKSLGTPTYGSTGVTITDSQDHPHLINFSRSTAVHAEIQLDVTFLSEDSSGAVDSIRAGLATFVNGLISGEDVVWSRMFSIITPHGKAQVNSLYIGVRGSTLGASNITIPNGQFANIDPDDITITTT